MNIFSVDIDENKGLSYKENGEAIKELGWDNDKYNAVLLESLAIAIGVKVKHISSNPREQKKILESLNAVSTNTTMI